MTTFCHLQQVSHFFGKLGSRNYQVSLFFLSSQLSFKKKEKKPIAKRTVAVLPLYSKTDHLALTKVCAACIVWTDTDFALSSPHISDWQDPIPLIFDYKVSQSIFKRQHHKLSWSEVKYISTWSKPDGSICTMVKKRLASSKARTILVYYKQHLK